MFLFFLAAQKDQTTVTVGAAMSYRQQSIDSIACAGGSDGRVICWIVSCPGKLTSGFHAMALMFLTEDCGLMTRWDAAAPADPASAPG